MEEQKSKDSARIKEIELRLEKVAAERESLIQELTELRSSTKEDLPSLLGSITLTKTPDSPQEKVDVFLKHFCGRKSVYPKLWENKAKGKKGYSPVCSNEWVRGVCNKPKIKCTDCSYQAFPPLDEKTVFAHLKGTQTIGTYAIREDDTTIFLATDFDGSGWEQDVVAFRAAARELGIQAEIERSRSGNGGHTWIFFSEPVSAREARQLGTVVVARAQASRHAMGLETFDRFFPNQDTLPKGGFGNLIALPLQKSPRNNGNSVFLNEHLEPISDQWAALAKFQTTIKSRTQESFYFNISLKMHLTILGLKMKRLPQLNTPLILEIKK